VILIMTTNAGASELHKQSIGFERGIKEGEDEEAITRMFSPEFRNRLDAIVGFESLTPEVVAKVVEKFILQLEAQLEDRNVSIELSEDAQIWIAEKGFDKIFGARPMGRFIQEHVKKPLADELLFGKLVKGGHVVITLVDGKLSFDLKEEPAAPKRKPRKGGPGGSRKSPDGGSGGGKVPVLVD